MQGNENFNDEWDDKFVDRAWEQMRQQLDRDMPVSQPLNARRKLLPYWLFLLILLVGFSAGIGFSLYLADDEPDSPIPSKPVELDQPIADLQTAGFVSPGFEEMKSASEAEESPPKLPDRAIAQQAKTNKIPSKIPTLKSKTNFTNPNSLNDKTLTLLVTKNNNSLQTEDNKTNIRHFKALERVEQIPPKELASEIQNDAVAEVASSKQAGLNAFEMIAKRVPEVLEVDEPDLPFAPAYKLSSPWSLGFQMASISTTNLSFNGIAVGLLVGYRLDQRFSIESGINYRFLQLKKDDAFITYSGEAGNYLNDDGRGNVNFDQQSQAPPLNNVTEAFALFPIYSMDYLSIPFTLSYSPKRWLRINVGVQIDRLLNTEARDWGGSEVASLERRYDAQTASDEVLSRVNNGVRKWNSAITVGFAYQPTSRIGLGMNYNFGLRDFTKDEWWGVKQFDAHKYLQWSINYYF